MTQQHLVRRLLWLAAFAVTFGFVEASVVVYLRSAYYPEGFTFPLTTVDAGLLATEISREIATIIMLVAVTVLATPKTWERGGAFLVVFGVWDLFYYLWLKILINWPATLLDWDVLFLIPLPSIGPVLAPLVISLLMIALGLAALVRLNGGKRFQPAFLSWLLAAVAVSLVLYSFTADTDASLRGHMPRPYSYGFLILGLLLAVGAYGAACWPVAFRRGQSENSR